MGEGGGGGGGGGRRCPEADSRGKLENEIGEIGGNTSRTDKHDGNVQFLPTRSVLLHQQTHCTLQNDMATEVLLSSMCMVFKNIPCEVRFGVIIFVLKKS